MKTSLIILLLAFISLFTFAQSPDGFNYQGIARDNKGKELTNQNIKLKISIVQNSATGTIIYTELHSITTNNFGLFNVKVGKGTNVTGNFSKINWSTGLYFIKVDMDATGGTNYVFMGTSQLISVPYAMMSNLSLKSLNDLDTSSINELQILKFSNDTLYLDKGGFVYLGKYDDKNAIQQIKTKLNSDSTYFESTINDERTDRQNNDNSLNTKIASDSNYLNGMININTTNINNEINNRTAADQGLKTKQLADSNFLHTIINNTNTNLNTETNSRITGDNNLKSKQLADSSYLKGLVTTETTSRTNADNNLNTRINTVQTKESSDSAQFVNYLTTLSTNITTETNNRTSGDNTLQTNINNENSARSTADNGIRSKVVSDSSYLKGLINTNTTNLNTEITNRTSTDNTLQSNITTETNSRISSDNTIKNKAISDSSFIRGLSNTNTTNINSEITNRTNADNTLQTNINTLKTKQINDSTALRGQINTTNSNLNTEITNRINGDDALKSKSASDSSFLKGEINTHNTQDHDTSSTNELQTLSRSNDTIFISNGGFVKLPSGNNPGDIQYWNGSAWVMVSGGQPGQFLQYTLSNKPTWSGPTFPTLSTTSASSITGSSATSGGNITNDGGAFISACGICWSTSNNPTTALSTKTKDTTSTGVFISNITGLILGTKYYIRAYATNSAGTMYGGLDSFSTIIPTIGQSYQGGIIAYYLQTSDPGYISGQTHGIIVTPSNQGSNISWWNGSYTTTGATSTALGTGNSNTNLIVANQGTGNYAAKLCYDLVLGGYSDWYLPSKDELNKLFLNKVAIGSSSFVTAPYWSSSEYDINTAWIQEFNNGQIANPTKSATSPYYVRAIRSF